MNLEKIQQEFSVCKIKDVSDINWEDAYCFVGKTEEELSLVCTTRCVPAETLEREDGWNAFRIQGVLDFSLVGILSQITGILAEHGIGIFAVSTYNTDYILIKSGQYAEALKILREAGYGILEGTD